MILTRKEAARKTTRGICTSRARWVASTPLIGSVTQDGAALTNARRRDIIKRLLDQIAAKLNPVNPAPVQWCRRARPHWMRHTHATRAPARGVPGNPTHDGFRHASAAAAFTCRHTDAAGRAQQLSQAFGPRHVPA